MFVCRAIRSPRFIHEVFLQLTDSCPAGSLFSVPGDSRTHAKVLASRNLYRHPGGRKISPRSISRGRTHNGVGAATATWCKRPVSKAAGQDVLYRDCPSEGVIPRGGRRQAVRYGVGSVSGGCKRMSAVVAEPVLSVTNRNTDPSVFGILTPFDIIITS